MFTVNGDFWQTGRKYGLFFIICFSLGSCEFSSDETRNVKITVVPDRPQVFENAQTSVICRRGQPTNDRNTQISHTSPSSPDQQGNDEQGNQEVFPKINVNKGWFKVGLSLENESDHSLVIDSLVFTISAAWGDDEVLSSKKEFVSGYCDTHPLYTISPQQELVYQPDVNHSPGNLQLYVDGISLPTKPPRFTDTRATLGLGTQNYPEQPNTANNDNINQLPSYRVELIIIGRFMDGQKNMVSNFRQKRIFNTR